MGCIMEEERKKRKKRKEGRGEREREQRATKVKCKYSSFSEKNELCSHFFVDRGERDRGIKKTKKKK
jgi:hypothetical protein